MIKTENSGSNGENNVTLSVIMPCYNVSHTLKRALDSVLMQETKYSYEIIIIDDASTDDTLKIAREYAEKYNQIIVLQNNKNLGNAQTFYNGLTNAKGDFFCVLDGDDYYTVRDKFQRQLTFFERDVDEEYVATAHYFVYDLGNDQVNIAGQNDYGDYNYADLIKLNAGYYHTATYMYRNIFKGEILRYYQDVIFRGDTPRTAFHLMFSNKKVKILDFVGSVYTFQYDGIWSSMSQIQQNRYQLLYLDALTKTVSTKFERDCILDMQRQYKEAKPKDDLVQFTSMSICEAIQIANTFVSHFAFSQLEFVLRNIYYSEYLDSLLATLGEIYRHNHPEKVQIKVRHSQIAIIIGRLNPNGGGIFQEIKEICQLHRDKEVALFITDMDTIPCEVYKNLMDCPNASLYYAKSDCTDKLEFFHELQRELSPEKMYVYTSHRDVFGVALVQCGLCKNVSLFSFDHGYICGLSNPNLDLIIAKRPSDYYLLHKKFGDRVGYIPTWDMQEKKYVLEYEPFRGHEKIITACGAARFYKLSGGEAVCYFDLILELLEATGGTHYHLGEIPEDKLKHFRARLSEEQIRPEAFVYIPWVEDIPEFLLQHNVDVFIEPFPTVSYKLSLAVMSCGVPVIAYRGYTRMSRMDFIYQGAPMWGTREEFLDILSNFTKENLKYHSSSIKDYYDKNHSIETLQKYIVHNETLPAPPECKFTDNTIADVKDYKSIFKEYTKINIMRFSVAVPETAKTTATQSSQTNSADVKPVATKQWIDAQLKVNEIRNSRSYRWGRKVVLFVKRTMNFLGLRHYDLNQTPGIYPSASEELTALLSSKSYHIGRILAAPVRIVRCIVKRKK